MDSICVWTCKGLPAEAADHRVGLQHSGPGHIYQEGTRHPGPGTASPDAGHQSPRGRLGRVTCPVPCPVLLSALHAYFHSDLCNNFKL